MCGNSRVCDFCKSPAKYDGKTKFGPWAYMCEDHFKKVGINVSGMFTELQEEVQASKECSHCKEVKPINEFYEYTDAHGVKRHRNECKKCHAEERKIASFRRTHKHHE